MICPVCGSASTSAIYTTPKLPLSIMSVTSNPEESLHARKASMSIRACHSCLHVYNGSFDPDFVSYSHGGCKMFNNGTLWQQYITSLQGYIDSKHFPKIVEIGAGDGAFLAGLTTENKLAYEPSSEADLCYDAGLNVIKDYFQPDNVLDHPVGTLYLMRHVMEHLESPSEFVEELTNNCPGKVDMIVEVPNIVNALRDKRIEDWVYEHAQHFTPTSLKRLFIRSGWRVVRCETAYNNEIILIHVEYVRSPAEEMVRGYAKTFGNIRESVNIAANELRELTRNKEVAFWGGTGKSTLSIHTLGSKCFKFRVVDSDPVKVGLCVPGMYKKIEHADSLLDTPADIIVITTSWRASDILAEIKRKGISCEKVLMYKQGKLQEATSV